MYEERVVLCGASAYEQKYYLNEETGEPFYLQVEKFPLDE